MAKSGKKRKIYRDARTGRFVTEEHVRKNPKTTVTETVEQPRRKKKK